MESFIPEVKQVPVDHDPFSGPAILRTMPTTEAQMEVFAASEMGHDANCAYVESVSLILTGTMDRPALEQALTDLVARHESLRSVISANGMRMVVLERMDLAFAFHDLGGLDQPARDIRLAELAEQDMRKAFNLGTGPMFRAMLIRTTPDEHILRMSGHHAVLDGWSLGILMAEASVLYSAHAARTEPLLPPAVPFSAYVLATLDFQRSSAHAPVEQYWTELFKGPIPRLDLPTDRVRPARKTFNGHRLDLPLDPDLVHGLRGVATRNGASFVTTLLSAFEVLLAKLTGSTDIVTGLPAAGQSDLAMKHLVGHCVNLLALRSTVDEDLSFDAYLKQRRSQVLDAFDHQKYTFGTLVQKLKVPREPGRIPLVPVVFNIDMNMDDGVAFAGLAHRFISNPRHYENFELFLNATGQGDSLILEWSYNTDLFDAATIFDWMWQLNGVISRIIADGARPIKLLTQEAAPANGSLLPAAEWHGTTTSIPRAHGMDALFDEVAATYSERTAIQAGEESWTYGRLHRRMLSLAAALLAAGVKPGDPVGLCTERCPDMAAAMLAILRCGAAFVPFDPSYPADRLAYMLADTAVRVLITQRPLAAALPRHRANLLILEDTPDTPAANLPPLGTPEGAAYIMYTSGSTGRPKGVVVPHRAVIRLVRGQNFLPFGPDLTFLQLSNISFDASTLELWGALLNGATLVLQPQQKPTLQEIIDTIGQHKVTTAWFTAGLFNLLVDEHLERMRGLKHILTGGDVLSVPHVRRALRALGPGVLINGYGPTENTTFTCCHAINEEHDLQVRVPIGKPIANTTVHLLDDRMQAVAVGEKGELYTGGDGVALGYWNQPGLTSMQFVDDPFSNTPGARLYRTGDLARWLPNGTIDFLGRADGQVKVRGFRVELGEIESAISQVTAVKDRVVAARNDQPGEKQLVAYLVPVDAAGLSEEVEAQEALIRIVRDHLRTALPDHMVPTAFVILPELPLTANGKVDKRALPMPEHRAQVMHTRHVQPRNAKEELLAKLWAEALGVPTVGVHDNFFDLGGHSLIGIQLLARVEERFGKRLPLNSLFQAPTVAALAKLVHGKEGPAGLKNLAALQPEGSRMPFFCVHGDEANHHIMRHLGKDQPYYAFFHQGEQGAPFEHHGVEGIARHYANELLSVQPEGPFLLGGYSFGGIVAYEMAQQLTAAGHEVPLLALFDMPAPDIFVKNMKLEEKLHEPIKRVVMRNLVERALAKGRIRSHRLQHFHIIDNYNRAIMDYRPKPYNGPVTVFKAAGTQGTDDMGWADLVTGHLDVHVLPGDHYSLIKDPEVALLVRELSRCIDRAVSRIAVEAV
ncbi:MAG: amino acid adenylation domain-containing protein [Flavobacteriales bacterium]|nr:amino acid adenylation domain-containing protein [Flavobacteriales bacterium]MBP9078625.1 amino acid adenylation domain-containing protein [Flavobacteriales bacterium]